MGQSVGAVFAPVSLDQCDVFILSLARLTQNSGVAGFVCGSDALMPVYVGCTLLTHFKEAIIQRKNSPKGLANPSAVGRWVVHALPAMLNAHVLPQVSSPQP